MRTGKIWRAVTAVFAAAALAATAACGGGGGEDEGFGGGGGDKTITIGYIAWDEAIAATEVWKQLLEAEGYKVETKQLEAAALYSGVANGNLDLYLDGWLPATHATYWKKYGKKIVDVGVWYEEADLGLAVPEYVKAKSLADLKTQSGDFGGEIIGIEPSAGMMGILKDEVVPQYGLDGKMKVRQSSTPAMLAALDKAYKAKKPIAVTMWRPHWAFAEYDIRYLEDPKKAWGDPDSIHSIASKDFAKENKKVMGWMKNFKMTPEQLAGLEKAIQDAGGNKEAPKAVKTWLKENKSVTDQWVK